jgi:energy-converting hydrogenase B subunit D
VISVLQAVALLLVASTATITVLVRDPLRQAILASAHGLVLGILFFVFAAPDVGLAQTAVGAVALPLMIMLALAKVRGGSE